MSTAILLIKVYTNIHFVTYTRNIHIHCKSHTHTYIYIPYKCYSKHIGYNLNL